MKEPRTWKTGPRAGKRRFEYERTHNYPHELCQWCKHRVGVRALRDGSPDSGFYHDLCLIESQYDLLMRATALAGKATTAYIAERRDSPLAKVGIYLYDPNGGVR